MGEDKRGKEVEEGRKRMNRKVSEEDVGSGERRGIYEEEMHEVEEVEEEEEVAKKRNWKRRRGGGGEVGGGGGRGGGGGIRTGKRLISS